MNEQTNKRNPTDEIVIYWRQIVGTLGQRGLVKQERGDSEGAEADFQLHKEALARVQNAEAEHTTEDNTGN